MAPNKDTTWRRFRRFLAGRLLADIRVTEGEVEAPQHFLHGFALDPTLDFHSLGIRDFNDVAWSLDLKTLEFRLSTRLMDLVGYTPDSLGSSMDWLLQQIHNDDRARIQGAVTEVRNGDRRASDQEFRIRFSDGSFHWVNVRALTVDDKRGRPLLLLGSFADVTNQMHAEEERDRLFNLSVDMLAVGDYEGNLQQLNPAWVRVLGWSRDDLMSRPLPEFVFEDDLEVVQAAISRLAEGETVDSLESRYKCRDGSLKWLSLSAFPYSERRLTFSVLRDITGKKAAEDQLLEYQARLRNLTSQLSMVEDRQRRVLAEAIHDGLAQQLFGIRAKVTLLKYPDKIDDPAQVVQEALDILDDTMADARTLSFELFPPVLHEVGLVAALEWLANQFRQRTGLACVMEEDGQGTELPADLRNMAFQTVRELLSNIYKHANADNVRIFVSHDPEFLTILAEDDGDGFDVSSWQSDRDLMDETGGFGLFSIRERLRAIDGRLVIDSTPGQGCRVFVSFPRTSEGEQTSIL